MKFTLPLKCTQTRLLVYLIQTKSIRKMHTNTLRMDLIPLNSNWLGWLRLFVRRIAAKLRQHWWKSADDWILRQWKNIWKPCNQRELFVSVTSGCLVRTRTAGLPKNEQVDKKLCRYIVWSLMSFNDSAGCHFKPFLSNFVYSMLCIVRFDSGSIRWFNKWTMKYYKSRSTVAV